DENLPERRARHDRRTPVVAELLHPIEALVPALDRETHMIERGRTVGRLAVNQRGTARVDVYDRHTVARRDPGARTAEVRAVHELHAQHFGVELDRRIEIVGLDRDMKQAGDLHDWLLRKRLKKKRRAEGSARRLS